MEDFEINSLTIKARPFTDKEDLLPICQRYFNFKINMG